MEKYSKKDLLRVLDKNLKSELKIIKLYLSELDGLNYAENSKHVDKLILESVKHSGWIIQSILDLHKYDKPSKLKEALKLSALREETGVKDIYAYEMARTEDKKIKKMFANLIKDETEHEKLVEKLV